MKHQERKIKIDEVVRGKARQKLKGYTCHECKNFYGSEEGVNLQSHLDKCSRHRHRYSPPPETQESFWNPHFPSTQECIDKGYILLDDPEIKRSGLRRKGRYDTPKKEKKLDFF